MTNNEKVLLSKEVTALKVAMNEAVEIRKEAEAMNAVNEQQHAADTEQIQATNKELLLLQTTKLQYNKEKVDWEQQLQALSSSCKEAQELNAKLSQSEKMLRSEKSLLKREVEALRAAAQEDGDDAAYADAMKVAYEDQIKGLNEELMMLQTTMMQYKKEKNEWNQEQGNSRDMYHTSQNQLEEVTRKVDEIELLNTVMSQEKGLLQQQVEALRTAAKEDGDAAVYADTMKAKHESQIREMNGELHTSQTTMLEYKKQVEALKAAAKKEVAALKAAARDDDVSASYAELVKESYEEQVKSLNNELLAAQTTVLQHQRELTLLKAAAKDNDTSVLYAESVKAAYEVQIKKLHEVL